MKKKQSEHENGKPAVVTALYDAETLAQLATKVKAEGFVPISVLRDEFGHQKVTQAGAVLYRDFRLFREVRRAWTDGKEVLGWEWANAGISPTQAKKVPADLGFMVQMTQSVRSRYADFVDVVTRCRWIASILGSVPVNDENGDPTNVFERDWTGHPLILRYHQRAMATLALPMIDMDHVGASALAHRIGWSIIRLPSTTPVKIVEHGIVELNRDGGKGKRRSECIAGGLEFVIDARVPTSAIAVDEYLRMLREAGKHVGLSPGRSAGFGDFEVLGAE